MNSEANIDSLISGFVQPCAKLAVEINDAISKKRNLLFISIVFWLLIKINEQIYIN